MASAHGGGLGIIGSGRSSSAETTQAREWKLDALADILDDVEISHAVVHVGGMTTIDSVVYKLASRGFEPISLVRRLHYPFHASFLIIIQHGDMNTVTRVASLNKFRTASTILRQVNMKVLVVCDVQLKTGETPHIPLVINYGELPHSSTSNLVEFGPVVA
jgi:translation initiation factor 4A